MRKSDAQLEIFKMADTDSDINPRKKIKTDHNPDKNGDHHESKNSQDSGDTDREVAETSETGKTDDMDVSDQHDSVTDDKDAARRKGCADEDKEDEELEGKDENSSSPQRSDLSDSESDVSALSDMSDLGEASWRAMPAAGPASWVYRCMQDDVDPRSILKQIIPDENDIPDLDDFTLWKLVINLVSEPPPRTKLPDINTLEDVIQLLHKCKKIMVLTGAGVSVSCGIPDFRSRNGIYARLAVDFPDLPDPQAMFDISYFKRDQRPFFKFAKEIFPGQFEPSKCHKFIKLIEDHGKLLRNYTQNIDTLEQVAGIKNVVQCHGSFATATCMECRYKCSSDEVKEQILNQIIPWCPKCDPRKPLSVMKPDIVFFGESLPQEFHHQMSVDKDDCDLLIVIGSSLKVRPVALIPNSLPAHVPQILINKEHLRNLNFDVELLGDCEIVVGEICRRLGDEWLKIAGKENMTQTSLDELLTPSPKPIKTNVDNAKTNPDDTGNPTSKNNVADENSSKLDSGNANTCEKVQTSVVESSDKCLRTDKADGNSGTDADSGSIQCAESSGVSKNLPEKVTPESADKEAVTATGKGKSAPAEISNEVKEPTRIDDAGPSCSSPDKLKPGSNMTQRNWRTYRHNVASKLGSYEFCFVPPHKYIFPEAEYFTWVRSDSESDSDSDKNTSTDSSRDLNQTDKTRETGEHDNDTTDLSSDDEDENQVSRAAEDGLGDTSKDKNKDTHNLTEKSGSSVADIGDTVENQVSRAAEDGLGDTSKDKNKLQ